MPISTSPALRWASAAFGTIFIGFGINCFLNPASALNFFELSYPILPDQKNLVDALLVVYGARDIFMGVAIYAAAYFGSTSALGWIVAAAGATAGVDGWVCKYMVGAGEMNHWGYAPILVIMGTVMAAGL